MADVMGVIAMLETRKRKMSVIVHIIHVFLTLLTIFWGLIYLTHYLTIVFHNRDIQQQQDKLLIMTVNAKENGIE